MKKLIYLFLILSTSCAYSTAYYDIQKKIKNDLESALKNSDLNAIVSVFDELDKSKNSLIFENTSEKKYFMTLTSNIINTKRELLSSLEAEFNKKMTSNKTESSGLSITFIKYQKPQEIVNLIGEIGIWGAIFQMLFLTAKM